MEELHAVEWIERCSQRLQHQWRTVDPRELDDVAVELWADHGLRRMTPELAAVDWLRLGVLAPA